MILILDEKMEYYRAATTKNSWAKMASMLP